MTRPPMTWRDLLIVAAMFIFSWAVVLGIAWAIYSLATTGAI